MLRNKSVRNSDDNRNWIGFIQKPFGPREAVRSVEQFAFRRLNRPVFQKVQNEISSSIEEELASPLKEETLSVHLQSDYHVPIESIAIDTVPLATRILAMELQRSQQQALAQINARQPLGCHFVAANIIPASVFTGELGRFLMMACDFFLNSAANTLLLPAMPVGKQYHALPCQPLVASDIHESRARAYLSGLRTRVANEHNRTAAAIARGDFSLLFQKSIVRPDTKQELAGIRKSLAIECIGLTAFLSHEARFSEILRDQKP